MRQNAESLINAYSEMEETEQKEFDRRYKELHKFRRSLGTLLKDFERQRKEEGLDKE